MGEPIVILCISWSRKCVTRRDAKLVELIGIEPTTSGLQSQRSPN
jgi:hypothetical protein